MESSKSLQEQIDSLAIEAKALIATAKRESRELTTEEADRFDAITKNEIVDLKAKLTTALNREEEILKLSNESRRQNTVAELDAMLNRPADQPRTVLPVNGREPGDADVPQDRIYVKQAKLKAFKNERDAYDSGMWLRALWGRETNRNDLKAEQFCQRRGLSLSNTATESTGAAGGYLTPSPLSSAIIEVRENVGVTRKVCNIQPMTANTLTIPKRNTGLTVYSPDEASAITTSDKAWKQIELIARKRAVASYISQELTDDALINVTDNVVTEMGYALGLQEDLELISGDGSGATYFGVTGLKSAIGSAGVYTCASHSTWATLDYADFVGAMGLLPERYHRAPSWICSMNFYNTAMLAVMAAAGGNTIATIAAGATQRTFLGYPVYVTSQMPTATATSTISALFGTFDMGVMLGDRTGVMMARDNSVGFLSDLITLKATSRYDIKVFEPGDGTNVGAYVALKTHS